MEPLLERLARGEVVVGDGAWGTQLMERGLEPGDCPEAFNLERPEVLTEIASLYLEAGAEILTSNTFGASPLKLSSYSLEHATETINQRGVHVLREAARGRAYVGASVGPTGAIVPRKGLPRGHQDRARDSGSPTAIRIGTSRRDASTA